ncbi:MAG: hypothetical protein H8E25_14390 [Planctomycetes bacterium]|nr:hypothetical protein [Planctomycetota bacterium]
MTNSESNLLAHAAAQCILGNLAEAGLDLVPNQQKLPENIIDSRNKAESIRILFLGTENDQSASDLLIAIADKGMGVPKDFVHMNLLNSDYPTIEAAMENYNAQIIIVLGAENGLPLFPGSSSPTSLERKRLLHSSYCASPILITESLNAMLLNPELKKTCWQDIQLAKEILNK